MGKFWDFSSCCAVCSLQYGDTQVGEFMLCWSCADDASLVQENAPSL